MSNRIKNILEFISIWGNSYFYNPLSENVYSPEALEKLANEIDAESDKSGTGLKSVRAQRLRYLAKTRAERLKKLEAAKDDAMFDDRDDEKVRKIGEIQSRVIGAEKAEYDSSGKPGTTSIKIDSEKPTKVLGKPNTREEPEEKSSVFSKLFGGIGKVAGGVARVAGGLGVARDLAKGVTGPIHHGNQTDILGAIAKAGSEVVTARIRRERIAELKNERENTTDPTRIKEIEQELDWLMGVGRLPRSRRSGASRPTTGTPKSGSI